jgi:ketosteroid isomerase-like protein
MLRHRPRILAVAVLSAGAALAPAFGGEPAAPTVVLPPELSRVLKDYEAAWRSRDPKALAQLFAEDGFVLATGEPPVRGRAAIEKHYAQAGGELALRAIAYATDGRIGYILGGYAWDGAGEDKGKFTLTLVKGADGRWLVFSDMDNANARRPDR